MSRIRNHKAALVVGGLLAVVAAGAAYAYWTNSGTGSGSAATGTNVGITVTQTTTPSGLYPGGPTASLAGSFTNTNAGKVYVHQITATIGTPTGPNIDGTHPCLATDYQINGFPVTVDAEVPATSGGTWTGASIQMLDTGSNQDGCQGATVPLTYASN
jgi:hypothetical protein